MAADDDTRELQVDQVKRELAERRQADESSESTERRVHDRRADKHAYLREKLRERRDSETED
jgi:hypothetical protein